MISADTVLGDIRQALREVVFDCHQPVFGEY